MRSIRIEWQHKSKGAALPYFALHPDFSSLCFNEFLRNGQAQPGALCLVSLSPSVRLEEFLLLAF